jgi:glutamyl-tRNA synthetase
MGNSMIRVRFAPSPTGFLHIGGARTALFNWLFARHNDGVFILRIEDTDQERSKEEYLNDIIEGLNWLGLTTDEGPYYQSKRLDIYRQYATKLVEKGIAYYQKQESNSEEGIIFKMPKKQIVINDRIRGEIRIDTEIFEDLPIIKSDGYPAYNFACVVDDATMGITHIIRGEDHISNTPKQIVLCEALGFEIPEYAHMPLILGTDRSRLSKRHGATSLTQYRKDGFLPEAMVNYLSLLGWSAGNNQEILDIHTIIKLFDLSRVNKTGAVFDIKKLEWINSQYIRSMPADEVISRFKEYTEKILKSSSGFDDVGLKKFASLYHTRVKTLAELFSESRIYLQDSMDTDPVLRDEYLTMNQIQNILELTDRIEKTIEFDAKSLENILRKLAEEKGLKIADIAQPVRIALTGKKVSPGIFEVIELLGKEKAVKRLKNTAR